MKKLILASLCLLSSFVHASSSGTIVYTGVEREKEVKLSTSVYRTEYHTEYYEDTCSREVYDGTEEVCHDVPHESCTGYGPACRDVCHTGPNGEICREVCSEGNRSCSTEYTQSCSQQARYHTETYSCTQSRTVSEEVFDHYVNATIKLEFGELPEGVTANEKFNIALDGNGYEIIKIDTSKNLLIFIQNSNTIAEADEDEYEGEKSNKRDTVVRNATYKVSFLDLAKVRKSLMTLSNIKMDLNQISFVGGALDKDIEIKYVVNLEKKKIFKNDKILAGEITEKEMDVSIKDGIKTLAIKFSKEKIKVTKGRFKVDISTSASFAGKKPENVGDLNLIDQKVAMKLKVK